LRHYAFNVGDYAAATAHLSDAEDLAYRRLLDAYYAREAPLPADEAACCRLARATTAQARKAVGVVLREFFEATADGWRQKRCDDEIERWRVKTAGAKSAADRRWQVERDAAASVRQQAEDAEAMRTHMRTHSELHADAMPPTNHEPRTTNQSAPTATEASLPTPPVLPNPKVKTLADPPRKAGGSATRTDERKAQARAVWQAYCDAYALRYAVEPVRNAKVNAQVWKLLDLLPAEEAPAVAAHFVRSSNRFYVEKGHDFGLLVADAGKLRTEWATGTTITATGARQADRAAQTGQVFNRLISEVRNGTEG
jgi:uncharacterized protein YdaU (DUF1376 family)